MLLGIISDSHDHLENLKLTLTWFRDHDVEQIIHCGDLTHWASLCEAWPENYSAPIHLVAGNGDFPNEFATLPPDAQPRLIYHGARGDLHLDQSPQGPCIAFCHTPASAKDLARSGCYSIVFYGHTHRPWIEKINSAFLINPGNLCGRRHEASFALYDSATKRLDLKRLSDLTL